MRILWLGEVGSNTGFGSVTTDLCRALIERGEDVRLFTFRDTMPVVTPDWLEGRLVILDRQAAWLTEDELVSAEERMLASFRHVFTPAGYDDGWAPDCVIILGDPAIVVRLRLLEVIPDGLPVFHYVPIEGVGLPPYWATLWQRIQPVAMSRFGAGEIGKLLGTEVPYVYHGVNTEDFYPATPQRPIVWPDEEKVITSRSEAKEAFGLDRKTTVILRTDANAQRKAYPALLRSMAPVLHENPDAILFIHAPKVKDGGNFDEMRSHFPPHIAGRMVVPDFHARYGGLPRYALATLYNAADIYVSNSSEGFGLTIAEAMACGVASVGLNFSAVPEVIGPGGVLVKPGRMVENIYSHWWAVADEREFGLAVHEMIRNKQARWLYAGKGPDHIRTSFTWAKAAEQFSEIVSVREAVAA